MTYELDQLILNTIYLIGATEIIMVLTYLIHLLGLDTLILKMLKHIKNDLNGGLR